LSVKHYKGISRETSKSQFQVDKNAPQSPFKKGEDFEMICFSLNAKPKFPPFLKGGRGDFKYSTYCCKITTLTCSLT